mmetsp:Transcript_810/g.1310  ORF Transcript_810/g.1310 Transcript_810/m.1310 type:complete len:220 (-) Transcript_810:70-729(-)
MLDSNVVLKVCGMILLLRRIPNTMTSPVKQTAAVLIVLLISLISPVISFSQSQAPNKKINLPPAPKLNSPPLPAKLLGGLILFSTSVKRRDELLSKRLLLQAQDILQKDPLMSMELGLGLESGGVFSSNSSIESGVHQLVMEFQLNGGNSWAQCRCHGFQRLNEIDNQDEQEQVQIVSLRVSNMDAALNGGWADVTIPNGGNERDDEGEYQLPFIPRAE